MKSESTVQVNYPSFLRRLIAGVIDFTILLTTSMAIGWVANSYFDGLIEKQTSQLEALSGAEINIRYAKVYDLPREQIQKLDYPIILSTLFYGLEGDRINGKLTGGSNEFDIFDNSKAVQDSVPNSEFKLAFPKDTDVHTIKNEREKFSQQYGKFIKTGNAIDRFRKAFPEFNHIRDSVLAEKIWHSFFPGYKESYEFDKQFGTYYGKVNTADYSLYVTILIIAYIIGYFSLSISSKFSATLGKIAVGIKILGSDGSKLQLGKSVSYTVCFILFSIGTFFTTFLPVLFNRNRQALHDRVCKVMLVCSDER